MNLPRGGTPRLLEVLSDVNDGASVSLQYAPNAGDGRRWRLLIDNVPYEEEGTAYSVLFAAFTRAVRTIFQHEDDAS